MKQKRNEESWQRQDATMPGTYSLASNLGEIKYEDESNEEMSEVGCTSLKVQKSSDGEVVLGQQIDQAIAPMGIVKSDKSRKRKSSDVGGSSGDEDELRDKILGLNEA